MKNIFKTGFLFLLILAAVSACGQDIRPPAVADQFYPGSVSELTAMVDGFLNSHSEARSGMKPMGLLCPHAGYQFSGPVAAYSYYEIKGMQYDTVIIVGPSHHYPLEKACVYNKGAFETPLGRIPVDDKLADELIASDPGIIANLQPHIPEHSIEVQLPFLQRVLSNFKIVPVLSAYDEKKSAALGTAIAKVCRNKNVLIIASSDLTHYPSYADANRIDPATLRMIETLDPEKLAKHVKNWMSRGVNELACVLCGDAAVEAVMTAEKLLGADKATILHYANSGDTPSGDKSKVVGYGAVAFYNTHNSASNNPENGYFLIPAEQQKLLKLARQTLEEFLSKNTKPDVNFSEPRLNRPSGAFVTLKKHNNLRGCIGHIQPIEPLGQAVRDLAIASATEDPRFSPVTFDELKDCSIEISVLSPLTKVKDASEIKLGEHGVIVKQGPFSGVFLPQVASETGWTKEEFLNHLCADKAGLPQDAWKDPRTDIFVFTAQVFGEKD